MDHTKKIYCFFVFIICSFSLFAQEYGSVQGCLKDEFSGDPIINAKLTLFIDDAIVSQTTSDNLGNFSIWNIEKGVYVLVISKMHFSTLRITDITIAANQQLTFNPLFEGENYAHDTLVFSFNELYTQPPAPASFISGSQKRAKQKQRRAAQKLD